jgi:AcrR family transcriptional regulator
MSGAPARPERRTHAERSADTRARIIEAVVECIAEIGFTRTTAVEIAQRAGVTWGAVQHHFGGKDGILLAVLEDSFTRFAARFEDFPPEGLALEERVSGFVDRAWEHFRSPHYRSTFEILLNHLAAREARDEPSLQIRMLEAMDALWQRVFSDAPLPRRSRIPLERYTIAVLSGLASGRVLQGADPVPPDPEIALLKESILIGLSRRSRRTSRGSSPTEGE